MKRLDRRLPVTVGMAMFVIVWLAAGCGAAEPEPAPGEAATKPKPPELRPGELKLTTERVVVFKDGYSLIVKRATGTPGADGELFTEQVPDAAVLGSFWAVPREGRLLGMTAGLVTTTEKTTKAALCLQHLELLKVNKGKECTVELQDKTVFKGTIREVLAEETNAPASPATASSAALWASPFAHSRSSATYNVYRPAEPAPKTMTTVLTGAFFVLATVEGDMLLPVNLVRCLTIKNMTITADRAFTTEKTAKRLTFRFQRPEGQREPQRELLVMYFCPGIRWIPTYRVELVPEDKAEKLAKIDLQAEILNEVEDLSDVQMDLVVGVPNFRFKGVVSPFSLEGVMRNALQQAAPQLMGQFDGSAISNALFSQRSGEWRPPQNPPVQPPAGGSVELPADLTAAGNQDLFIYSLPKLSLPKSHRAAVPIFQATAPYRNVRTWNVYLKRNYVEEIRAGAGVASPLVLSTNQVWHQVELTNNTKVPWTTGAAMLMQGGRPLSQELLTYTSPGGAVRIPVTVSVDVRGTFSEKETDRQLGALVWQNRTYARIEKEATLILDNHKGVPLDTEVVCCFGGHADEASDDGSINISSFDSSDWHNYSWHTEVNNRSTVTWKLKIEAGKAATLKIKYHYFARQH